MNHLPPPETELIVTTPTDAERDARDRRVGRCSRVGNGLYFSKNHVRLSVADTYCAHCRSHACDHLWFAAWHRAQDQQETL